MDRPRTKKAATLDSLYASQLRPLLAKKLCPEYLNIHDLAIQHATEWAGPIDPASPDEAWLKRFALHLRESGRSKTYQEELVRCLRRVVRVVHPYRFIAKTPWSELGKALKAEGPGHFGHYAAIVYLPSVRKDSVRKNDQYAVRRFLIWSGRPVRLNDTDWRSCLFKFEAAQREAGSNGAIAERLRQSIRRIVEHWRPGTIPHLLRLPTPHFQPGTVQQLIMHDVAETYTPRVKEAAIRTVSRLTRYLDGKPLSFPEFTEDFADGFLQWGLAKGSDGATLAVATVNIDRAVLNRASEIAASRGLMRRSLRIPKLPDPTARKRRPRPATASSNATPPKPARNGKPPKPIEAATELPATFEWSPVRPPSFWIKIFRVDSFITLRRRVTRGDLRGEPLTRKQWRFRMDDLTEEERRRLVDSN